MVMMAMVAVVSIVVTRIIRGAIVNASVVIIFVTGITVPTTVIAGFVVPTSTAEADAEVLGFGFCRNQGKQPKDCRNQEKIVFHSCNWQ